MAMLKFPEEERETIVGAGPDFPGSSGDRERGRHRPSRTPRKTVIAVAGDDGQPIARTTDSLLADILTTNRAILLALALTAEGASFTVDEVLAQVS